MRDVAVYTGLRLALLAAVWLIVQFVTPLRGLLAIAAALLISGIISVVLLDRTRGRAGASVAGVFRRIDERIERSRTAEDYDEPSRESDTQSEEQPVGEGEQSGHLQDGDKGSPSDPA